MVGLYDTRVCCACNRYIAERCVNSRKIFRPHNGFCKFAEPFPQSAPPLRRRVIGRISPDYDWETWLDETLRAAAKAGGKPYP